MVLEILAAIGLVLLAIIGAAGLVLCAVALYVAYLLWDI